MSFKAFQPTDIVVSSDSITATLWSNNSPQLTTFFTSSTQTTSAAGAYYYNVYQTSSVLSGSAVQFAIAYGNAAGSGSLNYNNLVNGKSPTATIYGQYQDLVLGDENTDFIFGALTSSEFYAISFERARYKESLFLGSLSLTLSGSSKNLTLTDNSNYVSSIQYTNGGTRVFQLISGSLGVKYSDATTTSDGYSLNSGSYGWLLPDIGVILLNPKALSSPLAGGGMAFNYSGSATASVAPNVTPMTSLFTAISGGAVVGGTTFYINSQETITSDYVFIRPQSSEFNYSENPSFISGSTGEVLYSQFINNPQTYITTVGLYNDANELLAVAKLSRPLQKDFTSEALIRVKLDF
jgi:hypothetical protein